MLHSVGNRQGLALVLDELSRLESTLQTEKIRCDFELLPADLTKLEALAKQNTIGMVRINFMSI